MSRPPHKTFSGHRRLLGDARRETTAAVHLAAFKRRRLAENDDTEQPDDENNPTDTRALDDNDVAVFADAVYEQDDAEADRVYQQVQQRMESRRQKQREEKLQAELHKYRDANPTLRQQFADLKTGLQRVSPDEWASIPDIGDYSVKKQKHHKFTPVPDSLLERARQETAHVASVPPGGAATDLASIGAGRSSLLGRQLDTVGGSVAGHARVNADNYLNELSGVKVSTDSEIGDFKKARLLLRSVTSTNPKSAPGWIAAARLEETAGRISDARNLILQGCSRCPREEDVWIEATRLHPRQVGRRLLAKAVRMIPKSPKIWLQAAALEDERYMKRRVLRKALELIPESEELWRASVELESPEGARILLSRAVECVPSSTEMRLALARLESYERAREILREARMAIPQDPSIWITAAHLEEARHGPETPQIMALLGEGVKRLSEDASIVKRDQWIEEAVKSEHAGYIGTVKAIVFHAISLGLDAEDRAAQYVSDANSLEKRGCIETARCIFDRLTANFSQREEFWVSYADLEKRCSDSNGSQRVLWKAVKSCSRTITLWLMLAKEKWKNSGADEAREVLRQAFEANPNSESLWLAAAKVEIENKCFDRARLLLAQARSGASSAKVYMKSALLERLVKDRRTEKELLEEGLEKYRNSEKMWLMLGQWYEREPQENGHLIGSEREVASTKGPVNGLKNARQVYKRATEECGKSAHLWMAYARYEEGRGAISKARAILERGRERCKGSEHIDLLWRESAYLEVRDSKVRAGQQMSAQGLQECGKSGRLWALSVALEPKSGQKTKSVEAIKKCGQDAAVLVEVGKYIWRSGKVEKARTWLKKAAEADADWGDAWGTLLALELEQGNEEDAGKVEDECVKAEPRHGDVWQSVSKRTGNETLTSREILRRVAGMMTKESNVGGL